MGAGQEDAADINGGLGEIISYESPAARRCVLRVRGGINMFQRGGDGRGGGGGRREEEGNKGCVTEDVVP